MDAKVRMDLARTIGVEDELATELKTGVDSIALIQLEVFAHYCYALLVGEGR